jgi:peptide/nickel transport system ATP-binding protein
VNAPAGATSSAPAVPSPLLSLTDLEVTFPSPGGSFRALRGVSFTVGRGEMVGLVGESGSGKSMTALSALRLVPKSGRISGRVELTGTNVLALSNKAMEKVRGGRMAMVFQDPMTSLHPAYTVGFQIAETVRSHTGLSRRAARTRAGELLRMVALPSAEQRLDEFPDQMSGGEQQRVMLAIALAGEPDLLFADEPTTALDVTVQAQILDLLARLRRELGLAIVLISHDLAVVAENCDRVLVLYAGQIVEAASTTDLFGAPQHPYTRALLATIPRLGERAARGHLPVLPGQPAELRALPTGCAFHPRCSEAFAPCASRPPILEALAPAEGGRTVRCWLHSRT